PRPRPRLGDPPSLERIDHLPPENVRAELSAMHTRPVTRATEVIDARGVLVRREPRPGDLRWDGDVWMRWSGRRWTRALYALRPDRLRNPARFAHEDAVTPERRAKALALAVEDQVATH